MRVGSAQRDLPAHVMNEYCRLDRSFDPLPAFDEDNLPRTFTYRNFVTGEYIPLFPLTTSNFAQLGVNAALVRSSRVRGGDLTDWCRDSADDARVDLAAISYLDEVRTNDLMRSRRYLALLESETERDDLIELNHSVANRFA